MMKNANVKTKEKNSGVKAKIKQASEQKLLIVFILTVIAAIFAATLVNLQDYQKMYSARNIALWIFGALSLLSLVWLIVAKACKLDYTGKTLAPAFCLGNFLCLTAGAWLYLNTRVTIGPKMLIIAVIAAGALYFIHSIFGRDFFMYSLLGIISIFALYGTRNDSSVVSVICFAVCFVLPIITMIALLLFKNGKGKLAFAGRLYSLPKNFKYYPFIVNSVAAFAGAIASIALPSILTLLIIGFAVLFLLIAVIYTIEAVYFS
jgi:hypothetical protein